MVVLRDPLTLGGRPCAIAASVQLVGDRWSMLVIREVMFGNHQFSQIARNTGAPRDRLTARLRSLVEAGILERRPVREGARHEGYYLTEAGQDLHHVLRTLLAWGDKWAVTTPPLRLTHHDHPLELESHCATCGEKVDDADVTEEMLTQGWDMRGRLDEVLTEVRTEVVTEG
ncbi:helix-turn-helix transcriptional regulator [Streptomyces sp. LRE541]|uniref:winged helix-turn-helix transcriptional regulator n=1 Tax=Streptomyces sp. LRE541 TaxID=2931983 RepID=UPI00200BA609|nr:helix-turn-helix domain-containing protein [Streptomyces sp. LRE541]UPZ26644.1 helix-turn-helix transcriptional regulator [Streptomyces sp. LRE541]